jgi:hypothetical protein
VTGCLKVPSLRNSELTGPYFHNGGMKNASEILLFYGRGQNFPNPEVASINAVNGAGPADLTNGLVALKLPVSVIEGVVAPGFLNIFTDDRVKFQKAPFDHPELIVPNGPAKSNNRSGAALDTSLDIPAVGAGGSTTALKSFEDTMSSGN